MTPRVVTVNLVNRVVTAPAVGGEPKTIHYVIGAGISHLDGELFGTADIVLNEETATQLGAKAGDTIRLDFFRR